MTSKIDKNNKNNTLPKSIILNSSTQILWAGFIRKVNVNESVKKKIDQFGNFKKFKMSYSHVYLALPVIDPVIESVTLDILQNIL